MANEGLIRVRCPNLSCRKVLAVPTTARGKTVRCRNCRMNIKIPGGGEASGENGEQAKASA